MPVSFATTAAIRYGYGLPQVVEPTESAAAMLALLRKPDAMARSFPITSFAVRAGQERARGELRKARRENKVGAEAALKEANRTAASGLARELRVSMIRAMVSRDGFRERLVRFWADHFSVSARGKGLRFVTTAYIEDAIRPNITGGFGALLKAAVTHPVMLVYLDQTASIGPNSLIGKKRDRGLNENLAREVLELHTLGVGGSYRQVDVREFAELLTGLNFSFRHGFSFRERSAEPGAETVLGQSYGGGRARLADIHAALDDLALHPDTGQHIARKLVVHFISDTPDPRLVAAVADAFSTSGGDLMATYSALLGDDLAWADFGQKAKQPFDFIVSAIRALGIIPDQITGLSSRRTRLYLAAPMQVMGQPWLQPSGPDGWPEAVDDWITPQGLAARVQWALMVVNALGAERDPQAFARAALGEVAGDTLLSVAGAAESRLEGMALVLASPEFNRR